ncbi:hypothetical protein FBZ84_101215 [Azospirillum baldaniorum]|uniref:hypothetical protein n=1 Tax=Azospirillum baldaniorum TaxID=1064539 RepID=UPI0011AC6BA4|nr:hypothetical protein [Azospirillum baldaniorum]TWA71948.1 hypothetical protein FBZ84_101215 [Azospirillum baldaniorum]
MEVKDTLGNIKPDHIIYADCGPCRRSFRLDVAKLIERLGPDCSTLDALRKVVCKECGRPLTTMRAYDSQIQVTVGTPTPS